VQRGDPTPERRPPTRGDSAPREGRRCKRSEGRLRTPPWRWLGGPSSLWKTLRSNAPQALGFGRSARGGGGGGKGQVTLMAEAVASMTFHVNTARLSRAGMSGKSRFSINRCHQRVVTESTQLYSSAGHPRLCFQSISATKEW
jgi:hypothetical protein